MMLKDILFIWIPKTGGTTVYQSLKDKFGMNLYLDNIRGEGDSIHFTKFNNIGNNTFSHINVKLLLKEQIINRKYWNESFKFTVVRNPYDRAVSLLEDFKRSKRISPDTTLREFAWGMINMTRTPGLFNVKDYSQAASQIDWIPLGTTIMKFETLELHLKSNFGIQKVPHLNKGNNNSNWREKYDNKEAIKLINDLYYDDFALLNYEMIL